jgi:aconitate hydratase
MTIYDASMKYQAANVPLLVVAGKEYGSGSSRDWAAKGTVLLGVRAVMAESFERIHRSNLVNMGVLPLQFLDGQNASALELSGREEYDITGITTMTPRGRLTVRVKPAPGQPREFPVTVRIDTPEELESFRHGGILPYVLRQLAARG